MKDLDDSARARRVMTRAETLSGITETEGQILRRYLSPAMREAHDVARTWMEQAGLTVREDAAGNLIGRRNGSSPDAPAIVCGSHLDTVLNAGRYDGIFGVLAGIEAADALRSHDLSLEIVAFADEEGTRFGSGYLGSRPFATGELGISLERRDDQGLSVAHYIREYGLDPDRVAHARRNPEEIAGYLELHIEQGPVLEAERLAVGAVTGIAAQTRMRVTVAGEAGHAGTVPMGLRRDALAGAVAMAAEVEAIASRHEGAVATIGQWAVQPGGINIIPNEVVFTIDHRAPDDALQDLIHAGINERFQTIASSRGLDLKIEILSKDNAVEFDPRVVDIVLKSCRTQTGRGLRLLSAAGHDAAMIAKLAPTGMIFIRCERGISHNPAENVDIADATLALVVLRDALAELLKG